MTELGPVHLGLLRAALGRGLGLRAALAESVGGTTTASGVWRFFSDSIPAGGVLKWNASGGWRAAWGLADNQLYAFGEDVFGNQLMLVDDPAASLIWNHETGGLSELAFGPIDLLEIVAESGLEWLGYYQDGELAVAGQKAGSVSIEEHLHWTQPLVLGGVARVENTSLVDRHDHLIGHAELWCQVEDLPLGSSVVLGSSVPRETGRKN